MTNDHRRENNDMPTGGEPDEEMPPAPWTFKIMVGLAVLYLAWRLIEGLVWVIERIT